MENVLASVIVPVYNVEGTLEACVKSIIEQTHKKLEIILVDDGSKDSSGELCEKIALKDSRVRVIHQENSGVAAARNTGIKEATADYLCFVDADDEIEPNMVSRLLENQLKTGAQLVVGGLTEYHKKLIDKKTEPDAVIDFAVCADEQIKELCSKYLLVFMPSKMFLKKIFVENELSVEYGLVCGEDHLLIYKYLKFCDVISFVDDSFYRYYCFNSNGATRFFPLWGQTKIYDAKKEFILKNCSAEKTAEYCANLALHNLIARINYLSKRDIKDFAELSEAYEHYWPDIEANINSFHVFDEKDALWLKDNMSELLNKNIKALYNASKKNYKKKNKRIENLKEILALPFSEKIKFIKSKF